MSWLSPWLGLAAGAAAVAALTVLYFLKLKRHEVLVSSTLLWKRAVRDLQVNAPFQRMRWNLLYLLQLLALAALAAALARPVLAHLGREGERYVILIDRSASMNATDVEPSRLAEAKRQARDFVDSLRGRRAWGLSRAADQAMVIAFAGRATVRSTYTSDIERLKAAIDAIEPSDGPSRIAEVLTVARAYATPGAEPEAGEATEAAKMVLFSDGRIADLDQVAVVPGELTFHRVGEAGANLAVVTMQARRSYEEPERLHVFANLANYGREAVARTVQLSIDADVRGVRPVTVPARKPGRPGEPAEPGRAAVSFTLTHPGAGVLEVRATGEDALAADDAAWAVLEPPRRLAVALVTEGNEPLRAALEACPLARLDVLTPEEFDALPAVAAEAESPYGLVVLDRHGPEKLARGSYLVFGPPPPDSGAEAGQELEKQAVVDWQERHPVLNFVDLENVFAVSCLRLELPRDAVVLAEFEDSPALALVRRHGGIFLLAGFDVQKTNWPFDAGFVMFCYNAASYVAGEAGDAGRRALRVGDPLQVQAGPGPKEATVDRILGPGVESDGRPEAEEAVATGDSGLVRHARTDRAGVYRVAVDGGPEKLFAVNLCDPLESGLAPADALATSGEMVKPAEARPGPANREAWPLLVAAGLVLVCVEWYVYNRKARLS